MKKTIVTSLAFSVLMGAVVAQAGNIPEFDAVCNDEENYFAISNSAQYGQVIVNNVGPSGPLNLRSCWVRTPNQLAYEEFTTTAGELYDDPVFPGMLSALTDVYNEGTYHWNIVLQMKPESDLNINIYDSVLKHNEFSPWGYAEQTGRYRAPWGQLMFVPSANPQITVQAIPGKYATPGFTSPVTLDARTIPGLGKVTLDDAVYTSKCLWTDDIVVVMPETGTTNTVNQRMYNLKQGDMISVDIYVPGNNTADIRYGADSITVKYIGIVGTWMYGTHVTAQ
ncbi:MAG: hypothetical protein FD168_111 [Desulfobulbaceae bacterium]|nr:MAG: hypothetical protein FD168_111 [Desulfobulbaceae bacterium]